MRDHERQHHQEFLVRADREKQQIDQRVQAARDKLAAYEVKVAAYRTGPQPRRGAHV